MREDKPRFELISKYDDKLFKFFLPTRATSESAGYDFTVASDIIIPSYMQMQQELTDLTFHSTDMPWDIESVSKLTKQTQLKPTLVPTGVKVYIPSGQYLQLSVRSSCPLKNWLILANGVGIIDADYYNNPDNEGHIYFQIINLFPQPILLKQGDKIGQGIFLNYNQTQGDKTINLRAGGFGSTDNFGIETSKFYQ